jgi:hypothetical protein
MMLDLPARQAMRSAVSTQAEAAREFEAPHNLRSNSVYCDKLLMLRYLDKINAAALYEGP